MQGLAEQAHKREDSARQAEHYRLKVELLEADLKKAKKDAVK